MSSTNTDKTSSIQQTLDIGASPRRGGRYVRRLVGFALVLVAALLIARSLAGSKSDSMQYQTQVAVRGNLSATVTATGNLKPTNQVDVGSELSGTIRYVDVDYNDHVERGQVLARLDTSKLQAQVLQSKASLESAQAKVLQVQATLREARSAFNRLRQLRDLSNNRAVSQTDFEMAEAALARAVADEAYYKAEVSRTRAVLEANETDLAKMVIRSPINGIVLARSVEPGQTVAATFQAPVLFTLAEDLTQMELHVSVDEADVGEVREGQEATFNVDAYPNRHFPARITQLRYGAEDKDEEKTTNDGVVTYVAVLHVDNADLSLRPGMTATAEITVKNIQDALLVPNAALRFTPPAQEKKSGSRGNFMSKLLPRPPRLSPRRVQSSGVGSSRETKVWVLRDSEPVAMPVKTGATNGILTVIEEGAVEPGMPLAVDAVSVKE